MSEVLYVAPVPAGQVRTVVNPPSNASAVMPAGIATTVIAAVAVLLRVFTRTYVVEGVLGADDYLALCAMAFSIAFLVVGKHLFTVGAGLHMWDVPMSDYSPAFLQTTVGATLTYAISISFAKMSVLAFYLRISPDRTFRRMVYALLGLVIAYTVTYILLMVFRCSPVAYNWDLSLGGKCIDSLIPMMTLSIANIMLDTVILLLPVRVVVPLQIPNRQKISLVLLFATGGFVIAAAIKRTVIMPPLLASPDYTWELPEQFVWSFIEVNAGIICASVPALKPLCMRYLPFLIVSHLRSSQERSGNRFGYSGSHADKSAKSRTRTRSSRRPYSQSYELPSRDDLPSEARHNDDEARLWSTRKSRDKSRDKADSVAVTHLKDDSESADSIPIQYPGRIGPASAVTSNGFGAQEKGNPGGIKVTKETTVSYNEN